MLAIIGIIILVGLFMLSPFVAFLVVGAVLYDQIMRK